MTVRVLLVRHGESTWNAVRRWQGRADPPLSVRGERQALDAVERAAEVGPFDAVVSSTLHRARRTAELLAGGLDVHLLAPIADLGERDAGEWEGLTRAEIEERDPGFLAGHRRPPGYEDDRSVVERAGRALVELAAEHPGATILIVSHGGLIGSLERVGDAPWQRFDNLEARWFEIDPTANPSVRPVGERVELLADGAGAPADVAYA